MSKIKQAKVQIGPQPIFTRASNKIDRYGNTLDINTPDYYPSDTGLAVMVEEGTTNILPQVSSGWKQGNISGDNSGFSFDPTRIVTSNAVSVSGNTAYTISVKIGYIASLFEYSATGILLKCTDCKSKCQTITTNIATTNCRIVVGKAFNQETGLVLNYNFRDYTNTATDHSVNGYHGTIYGTTSVPSSYGLVRKFDGIKDNISVAGDKIGTGDCTILMWIKPKTLGGGSAGMLFSNARTQVTLSESGFRFTSDGGSTWAYSVANTLTLGVWQCMAFTRT
jgi:hypothetical protein